MSKLTEIEKKQLLDNAKKYVNRIWAEQTELAKERNTTIAHYINIATPYAEQAKALAEALEDIKNMETSGSRFDVLEIVNKALTNYKL